MANDNSFSEAELLQIEQFSHEINLLDSNYVSTYGVVLQEKIATLPDTLLNASERLLNQDIYNSILDLLKRLEEFTPQPELFEEPMLHVEEFEKLQDSYEIISSLLTRLQNILCEQELILGDHAATFSKLEAKAIKYAKKSIFYIEAGKVKLSRVENTPKEKVLSIKKAFENVTVSNACKRFRDRLASLENSLVIASQLVGEIAIYKKSNEASLKHIQNLSQVIVPEWKKQMQLALKYGDLVEAVKSTSYSITDFKTSNQSLIDEVKNLKQTLADTQVSDCKLDAIKLMCLELKDELNSQK